MIKVQPKNGYMLIEYSETLTRETTTASGIVLAKPRSPAYLTGVVLDAGEGSLSRDGLTRVPPPAKVGDRVLLRDNAGSARELGFLGVTRKALILPDDILAVLEADTEPEAFTPTADIPTEYEVLP